MIEQTHDYCLIFLDRHETAGLTDAKLEGSKPRSLNADLGNTSLIASRRDHSQRCTLCESTDAGDGVQHNNHWALLFDRGHL